MKPHYLQTTHKQEFETTLFANRLQALPRLTDKHFRFPVIQKKGSYNLIIYVR
jgi:hypothetical protein